MLHGVAAAHAERIQRAREEGPFRSWDDFARRSGLSRAVLSRLANAGVFGSLGLERRQSLWHALAEDSKELPLFRRPIQAAPATPAGLPEMSEAAEVLADYRTTGMSLRAHPLEFLRPGLNQLGVVTAAQLKTRPDRKPVCVAGIVLVRQRPGTAKGITFVTLEDETGMANLIVRPAVWKRHRSAALGATVLLAHGRLQRQGEIIHVLATKLEDLSGWMRQMRSRSRDFC
jgi:error-prone DNA polymerase